MTANQQLLAEYVGNGSEPAFRELVTRYIDLVNSTALRLVESDAHLAEDVVQTVFADLARMARTLSPNVMLGGWLHRHTCFVASKIMRTERRRRARERQAVEMNVPDHSEANLSRIAPLLDDAINRLGAEDRSAVLLRFFEQRDFRDVGEAMGTSENTARMRVNRALDKLHVLLKRRGVIFSTTALATTLASGAVVAAPAGMAIAVSSSALATAAAGGAATLTLVNILTMTKLKLSIISAVVIAGVAIPLVIHNQSKLRDENQGLQHRLIQLSEENASLSNQVAHAKHTAAAAAGSLASNSNTSVAALSAGGPGAATMASGAGADSKTNDSSILGSTLTGPMRELIREQQKAGMKQIYESFAKELDLSKEQTEKLNDILADNVMDNIDKITIVLREGKTTEEMKEVFARQDSVLQEKVKAALGDEGYAKYQDYTHNLLSRMTTDQFKKGLSDDKPLSDELASQFQQVMQEEMESAVARAGLDANYQAVPILNFQNIASEETANQSLAILDEIYTYTGNRAAAFLTPEQLGKFTQFRANAVSVNRMALVMNRKMMAPAGK